MTTQATDGATDRIGDLDAYVALPRASGLRLSPDGTRLVTTVATLDAKGTRYVNALWEVDPAGTRPARRLTRSRRGESSAAFTPAGDLLFTSARPDPDGASDGDGSDDDVAALWLLPRDGAEARVVAHRHSGIGDVHVAAGADVLLVASDVLPTAQDAADDERLRTERKDAKVQAILHDAYPVRYWDHDLGPASPHWFVGAVTPGLVAPVAGADEPRVELTDVTPGARAALVEQHGDLTPDGRTLVTTWAVPGRAADLRTQLVAVDLQTGERRVLVADAGFDVLDPVVSPDGRWVAFGRETVSTPQRAPRVDLAVVPVDGGTVRPLTEAWDRWPSGAVWLPGSDALLVVADDEGRAPVFHVDLASGRVRRVTSDDAAFSDLQVAPDGATAYALRSSYAAPPHVVRIDLAAASSGAPVPATPLPGPAPLPELPGRLEEVRCTAADGTPLRAWLALPATAGAERPAPLLLWIHGGPLGSWNAWSWRWNPWLLVAAGYAVLLPDPALSTGYGQEFVQRGWGAWGAAPFTDLMDVTDAVLARDDVDGDRTAAMGGSFGGYMANWVAGHTDRFRAIVSHAGLWALDQFGATTDAAYYWQREMTEQMAAANSPHTAVGAITTPMLVVHGDKDYRVPVGEALRLWYQLLSSSAGATDDEGRTPHRFLYFPDENHWVLSPRNATVWYGTVLAFLAEHVLGEPVPYPRLLG